MKTPSDQQLALHCLAHRDGYSLGYVFRQSWVRYMFLGILLLVCVSFSLVAEDRLIQGFFLWAIGMCFGAIVRDLGWLRKIKKQWQFTERIIDWNKVEKMSRCNEPK